jgi:hypothetical protein
LIFSEQAFPDSTPDVATPRHAFGIVFGLIIYLARCPCVPPGGEIISRDKSMIPLCLHTRSLRISNDWVFSISVFTVRFRHITIS